jgi:hypothetical protein
VGVWVNGVASNLRKYLVEVRLLIQRKIESIIALNNICRLRKLASLASAN